MNPLNVGNSTSSVEWPGKDPEEIVLFNNFFIDYDFVETFGITMEAGRDFDRQFTSDSSNFIINEKAAEAMGYTADSIINQEITFWGDRTGRIVGVMKDFNIQSIHVDIEPLILLMDRESYWMMHIRLNMLHFDEILAELKKIQRTYATNYSFEYEFLNETYADMYKGEEKISQLMNYFALVAIIISCLGL